MVVMKMKHIALLVITVLFCNSAFAGVISVAVKTIPDAVTVAARKSGKALSPAMRNAAETAVKKAVANYGDDVLKTVMYGGLERVPLLLIQIHRMDIDVWCVLNKLLHYFWNILFFPVEIRALSVYSIN